VQEALEELRRRDVLEHVQALAWLERRDVGGILQPPLQPGLAPGVLDVGELDADLAAVGRAQALQDLAQRLHRAAREIAGDVGPVEIVAAEAVVRRIQLGEIAGLPAQGIRVRDPMSAGAIGMDQPQHARVLVRHLRRHLGARGLALGRGLRGGRRRRRRRGRVGLLEELRPALVDRAGVHLVALADLLDEGRVHAEARDALGDLAVLGFRGAAARGWLVFAVRPDFAAHRVPSSCPAPGTHRRAGRL
jgi:hypothetical protein